MSEENNQLSNSLDRLLSKYLSIWLWSILFGGATTLTFSLTNVRGYENWGALSQVISLLMAVAIVFVIIAWLTLFSFLKQHIIPGLFLRDESTFEQDNLRKNARYLTMAFYSLIMSGIVRLMMELSKSMFDYLT